jgi:hypothetical protein
VTAGCLFDDADVVALLIVALDLVRSLENAKNSCSSFLGGSCNLLDPEDVLLMTTGWSRDSVSEIEVMSVDDANFCMPL